MTEDVSVTSDEPTRLEKIVSRIFSSGASPDVHATDSAVVRLRAGADAQDDCAIFTFDGCQELVVGSDYVRGPKFRLYEYGFLDNYDLGYYLVAANVSDIAAMGARPIGLLSVVRYPPDMSDDQFAQVLEGIRDACSAFDTANVGGDIGGAERLILSATALGVCRPGGSLLRTGARPGDILCTTGPTGYAGAAMHYFRSMKRSPMIDSRYAERLLDAWRRPVARVREGICLADSGYVTSCQDTSDGLKATINSLAAASDVGFVVDESEIAVPPEVSAVCDFLGLEELPLVMGDSVDFQLAFTVPPQHLQNLQHAFDAARLTFTPIGRVTEERQVVLQQATGELSTLPGEGWRHVPDADLQAGSSPAPG